MVGRSCNFRGSGLCSIFPKERTGKVGSNDNLNRYVI